MKPNRTLSAHTLLTMSVLATLWLSAAGTQESASFEEITVERIRVVDSEGRERVSIAGEFPPRRKDIAGVLFHNEEGTEAGGLIYYGRRHEDGTVEAGGLLTFDQFNEDQILAMEYAQVGDKKRNGLRILDRPNEISERVLELYRAVEGAESEEEREAIKREMLPKIPAKELAAQRLYVGRDTNGAAVLNLCDATGKARLRLRVTEDGEASIVFLDESGEVKRTLKP